MNEDKEHRDPNFLGRRENVNNLTRRELFAAMAMQGICARRVSGGAPPTQQFVSTWAVEYADALIAELDK